MPSDPSRQVGVIGCLLTHPEGLGASATIYSLTETANTNDIEPYEYLLRILKHIGPADTLEKLEALLP